VKSKFAVLCFVVALTGASALAVGFIGTPTAEMGKGQWGVGFNYSYSSQDLNRKSFTGSGWDDKLKLTDFNVQRYYGTLSYGIDDCWDIYVQLGFADVKANAVDTWAGGRDEYGTNFDNDFAWGWGTKVTLAKQDKIDWGATFQMNWLDTSGSNYRTGWGGNDYVADIDVYDFLIAVGPTVDMGGWQLYGGPYYYYLSGDYDFKDVYTGGVDRVESHLRNSDFGGFIGTKFNLTSNISANIEGSSNLGNGWGIGTGVTFKF
jgi:hypothetical protein